MDRGFGRGPLCFTSGCRLRRSANKRLIWIVDGRSLLVSGVPPNAEALMKFARTLALALMVAVPAAAHAQINLAWNDCITQSSAAENLQYACDGSRNGDPFRLVASFISSADVPRFVAVQMYLDVTLPLGHDHFMDPLPDWWKLGVDECRDGNLVAPTTFSGIGTGATGACQNPWLNAPTATGFQYTSDLGFPHNHARLVTAFARNDEFALVAGQQYLSQVLTLDTIGDVLNDDGLCPGCCQSMMISLEKIELYQSDNTPPITLTSPAPRKHVWWNEVPCDAATSAHRTTWGAVKATYR